MIETVEAANSGYRFMPGVSQYSAGVAALPGFTIERVRFTKPVPLRQGFDRIAKLAWYACLAVINGGIRP